MQVPRVKNYGKMPLVATPFCTTSVCSTARVAPRNAVNMHAAFVSDDDKVLLKSLSYGAVSGLLFSRERLACCSGRREHRL